MRLDFTLTEKASSMKRSVVWGCAVSMASAFALFVGCSGEAPEGKLPETKTGTVQSQQEDAKKLEMMKGEGYKGAPGMPYRKK